MRIKLVSIVILFVALQGWVGCSDSNNPPPTSGGCGPSSDAIGWQLQNPLPTHHWLFAINFIDKDKGWIVGGGGTILFTDDGGDTWTHQQSNYSGMLWNSFFLDENHGWIVTRHDVLLSTDDGGANWKTHHVGDSVDLSDVHFFNEKIGWLVGTDNDILHTTDGGETWQEQTSNLPSINDHLQTVFFIDSLRGWVSGGLDAVLYTENAGTTWVDIGEVDAAGYQQLHFHNDKLGFGYVAPGWILKTQDGGRNWERMHRTRQWLHGMFFLDSLNGWVVGENGLIDHTADGGVTWSEQPNDYLNYLLDVFFVDENRGWIAGQNGLILKSEDGGRTWISNNKVTIDDLYEMDFVDRQKGWAVGKNGTIISTCNSGESWQYQDCPKEWYWGVDFVDDQRGWAVGTNGTVVKTEDGGANWITQQSNTTALLHAVHAFDKDNVWAVGSSGTIIHTSDGVTWENQTSGITSGYGLFSVFFIDDKNGWAAGNEVIHTADGGVTWEKLSNPTLKPINDIYFVNDTVGYAAALLHTALKTVDGGKTWTLLDMKEFGFFDFISIQFLDENTGWMVGEYINDRFGIILFTEDGGDSWVEIGDDYGRGFYSVKFIDKNIGWTVGASGIILHTTTGGIQR